MRVGLDGFLSFFEGIKSIVKKWTYLDLFISTTLTGDERYGPYLYIVFAVKTYKITYSNSSNGISSNEISYRTGFRPILFTMKTTGHKI